MLIAVVVIIALVLVFLAAGIRIVPEGLTMVIERLGKYKRTLESGINIIIPFFDRARTVSWDVPEGNHKKRRTTHWIDLREQVYDYPTQGVITKDNVTISIDALLYFQINNAADACYEVANLTMAIEMLAQTTLRNVIGKLTLDECLTSRDDINRELCVILDEATDKWGVKVNRVEVKDIDVPQSIRSQMEKQMSAERDQRAMVSIAEGEKQAKILEAEGFKTSEINKAEGEKQAAILRAEGEAEARRLCAEAEAEAIERIKSAIGSDGEYAEYLRSIRYIDAMKDIFSGKDNKTIFMPYETEASLSSIGTLSEMIKSGKDS